MSEFSDRETPRPPGKLRTLFNRPIGYLVAGFVAAGVSVAIYGGAQYYYQTRALQGQSQGQGPLDNPASADTKKENGSPEGTSQLRRTSESFRNVFKKVGPAVVSIKSTKGKPRGKGGRGGKNRRRMPAPEEDDGGDGMPGDPFFDFFNRFGSPFQMPYPQDTPQTSLGSGIIVDKKGIVVTNNHVIEDASEILVTLSNEKIDVKAKVVGTDAKTDLAVLRLEGNKSYPFAEWADSDTVEVGDWAIAIGSPFALSQSLTVGVVSAKGRNSVGLTGGEYGGDLIQTDAAINPGNSGGPLCDLDGKVMGVNTAIYTRSGGYMGIGFAIPSNLAKEVTSKLATGAKIVRGWLGVYIQPLDPEVAKELGVKDGVAVHEVIEGSPAAKAGLQAGDVVIEVDGKQVKEVNELQRVISNYKPGQTVKIKAVGYTDKKTRTITVKIGTLPDKDPEVASPGPKEEAPDKLGLLVGPGKGKDGGVVVEAIQPGSVADQMLGLEVGDVIVRINRQSVNSVAAYKKLIGSSKRINIEIRRKGRTLFFSFASPE